MTFSPMCELSGYASNFSNWKSSSEGSSSLDPLHPRSPAPKIPSSQDPRLPKSPAPKIPGGRGGWGGLKDLCSYKMLVIKKSLKKEKEEEKTKIIT